MFRYVEYHSTAWALLVETGWVTVSVANVDGDDGIAVAKMLHDGRRR